MLKMPALRRCTSSGAASSGGRARFSTKMNAPEKPSSPAQKAARSGPPKISPSPEATISAPSTSIGQRFWTSKPGSAAMMSEAGIWAAFRLVRLAAMYSGCPAALR